MSARGVGAPATRSDDLITVAEARALLRPTIREVSDATTIGAADIRQAVHLTGTTARAFTVATQAEAGWIVGVIVVVAQMGTGQITLAGASGVTLRSAASLTTRTQYSEASLRYLGADVWLVAGDLV